MPLFLMVLLGALFPRHWWHTGFIGSVIQLLFGTAFWWLMSTALTSSAQIPWGAIYWMLGAPIILYPLATFAGSRWIQSRSKFWIVWGCLAGIVCVAMAVY